MPVRKSFCGRTAKLGIQQEEGVMALALLDQFSQELEIEYREEKYRVRDNGAVYRPSKSGKRGRPLDGTWTFGRPCASTGYMWIGSHVVHRIIAFAFHGEQPSEKHIVDHIDTNRRNNRADNLRWITRLENLLLNPITLQRIIIAYGSLDEFLKNPGLASGSGAMRNFEWMRSVSREEADQCRKTLLKWAEAGKIPKGGLLGEWVYRQKRANEPIIEEVSDIQSLTETAVQRHWRTPTEFPICPNDLSPDLLLRYAARLECGAVFSRNAFGEALVVTVGEQNGCLSVVSRLPENSVKGFALAKVTVEDRKIIHEAAGTYFTLQGAMKEHCKLLNLSFDSGDTIDDYC